MGENIVLIDWLSITTKDLDEVGVEHLVGMEEVPWELVKGARGYQDRLYFGGISIHYDGRDDMGVWLEMSGQGCRTFETVGTGDYERLFQMVRSGHGHITRLDVAYDDHTGVLPLDVIVEDTLQQRFVSKSRFWDVNISSDGKSLYHGSPKSDIRIRIYDKAAERHCGEDKHWVRVELQLRDERALRFISLDGDLGFNLAGVICNYLRYVIPEDTDSNRWRWPLTDYWSELLCGATAVKLYDKPGVDYNIDHCERYVYKFAGNAIDALIQIYGPTVFLDKLKHRNTRPNPKYAHIVDLYKGVMI